MATDGPLVILPGRSRHYLRTDTGQTIPSVTTIVGLTPKPFLLNWVVSLAAGWAAANAYTLAQMNLTERVDAIKAATRELREAGAKRGTRLHEFAELYVWLGAPEWPWEPDHAEQAVMQIVTDLHPTILHTEAKIWNGTIGYAGTIDGLWAVTYRGRPEVWLIDWKTSRSRTSEWALQMTAYRNAETIVGADGTEHPMPHVDRCVVLHTPYEGEWTLLEVTTGDDEWEAFKAAALVLGWHDRATVASVLHPIDLNTEEHNNRKATA